MKEVTFKEVFLYLIGNMKLFPISIFVMFWIALIWSIDLSLRPYLLKVILNRVTSGDQQNIFSYLTNPILLYLGSYILLTISFRLYGYFVEINMIPQMRANIANEALKLLVDKSHHYYQNNFSGSLANKVNDLARSVPEIIQIIIDRFFSHFIAITIAIITLWQVNIIFALFIFIWTIIFIIGALFFAKYFTPLADKWSEYGSIITGKIVDVLSNILSVRLFSAKTIERQTLNEILRATVNAEQKMQWANFWMSTCCGCSFLLLQVLNFYFLCKGRQEGWITVGDFALVLVINISIIDFLWWIAREFSEFAKLFGRITQALRAILDKTELKDKADASELKVRQGQIVFDKVRFQYKGTEALFKDKSITIEPGQKVGLVGYSGSGKTSFVNLILRLYDVTEGHIFIDGQDVKEVTQDSLRANIGMIPQDPSLFHRSLMDNIRYGRSSAIDEEVIEAAKKAYAHDFIINLPEGYHSLVGERGVKLSGGQRQRIAIARAILKNAPILILDEATSQLDSVAESYIQESLWKLMQNKSTIVIAHRLSTLLHMDRILVFDQGQVVEDGTHSELLAKKGCYSILWDAQVGGFLPEMMKEKKDGI